MHPIAIRTRLIAALTVALSICAGAFSPLLAQAPNICDWTGLWTATGSMTAKRDGATATALQNGKLLVVGGYDGINTIAFAEVYDPVTGAFAVAGSLATGRAFHTATLLADGRVLVAGGISVANGVFTARLASAEIFNPSTGNFTPAMAMTTARQDASSVLLADGRVLVTGGFGPTPFGFSNDLAAAEIFSPQTGAFTATGSMIGGRSAHTSTRLQNGKVLVAGGVNAAGSAATAELFDPVTGGFASTGPMQGARAFHTATLLPSGVVVVAGGSSSGGALASVESFNPSSNTFSTLNPMGTARAAHATTLLPSGALLVTGGENSSGALASAELLTGTGAVFTPLTAMPAARTGHKAAVLPTGNVIVVGGRNAAGRLETAALYDPLFTLTGSMNSVRSRHTATRLVTGQVLVAGGMSNGTGSGPVPVASAELFSPSTGTFTSTGSMSTPRQLHTATELPSGRILMTGGFSAFNTVPLASAELYDPFTGTFSAAGSMSTPRRNHTATLLANGKVLIVGGASNAGILASAELYDPMTNSFSPTGSLNKDRVEHTATRLLTGKVLITGGWSNAAGGIAFSTELYDPGTGTFTAPPPVQTLWTNRAGHVATLLPNGQVLITGGLTSGITPTRKAEVYDPGSNSFSPAGDMSTPRVGHTATLTELPGGKVMVLGGINTASTPLATVETFDPATWTFTVIGRMELERASHTATLLLDSRLLVTGGTGNGLATAEVSKPTHCGPMITMLSPASGYTGMPVTISGAQFLGAQNGSVVTFNNIVAGVSSWSDGSIVTSVPAGATTGPVVVTVNGRASNAVTFSVDMPDLLHVGVTGPTGSAAPGASVSVTTFVQNQGFGTAGATTTRFYLSLDTVKDAGDTLMIGGQAVSVLLSGWGTIGSVSTTVPGNTAPGTYYLLACADDLKVQPELDETNNCLASGGQVQILEMGDLMETRVSDPPPTGMAGDTFAVTDDVVNTQKAAIRVSTTTRYYLSLDRVWDRRDILMKASRTVPPLAGQATDTGTVNVDIPFGASQNKYYLLACADDRGVLAETDETNNCVASRRFIAVQ